MTCIYLAPVLLVDLFGGPIGRDGGAGGGVIGRANSIVTSVRTGLLAYSSIVRWSSSGSDIHAANVESSATEIGGAVWCTSTIGGGFGMYPIGASL